MRPCGVSVFWLFRHEARALPRSLQSCPVLPPGRSRATCSWVCTNPTQRLVTRPQILRPQNWSHSRLVQFSSSSIQLSKLKTPQKRPPVAIPTSDSHEVGVGLNHITRTLLTILFFPQFQILLNKRCYMDHFSFHGTGQHTNLLSLPFSFPFRPNYLATTHVQFHS